MQREGKEPVSLSGKYDGTRVLNTPLSLRACAEEGVDPKQLLREPPPPPEDAPARTDAAPAKTPRPPPLAAEKARISEAHRTRQRERLLGIVRARYSKVVAKQRAPQPTDLSPTNRGHGSLVATEQDGPSPRLQLPSLGSFRTVRSTAPRTARSAAQGTAATSEEDVVKFFFALKRSAEEKAAKVDRLRRKAEHIEGWIAQASALREKQSEERAAQNQARRDRALLTHEHTQGDLKERSVQRLREKSERSQRAMESVIRARPPRDPHRGDHERQAAVLAAQSKLEKLHAKIAKASDAAQRRAAEDERRLLLRAFETELVAAEHTEQNERSRRIAEFKRAELSARVTSEMMRQKAAAEATAEQHRRTMVARETADRQKALLAAYVSQHEGELQIPTPDWLQPILARHQQRQAAKVDLQLTARSDGGERESKSPRSANSFDQLSKPQSARLSTNGNFVAPERFTIFTSDPPPQRCFAKWMYED